MAKSPENLCSGAHDPRVLPLHVFDNAQPWTDLHLEAGISHFNARYGQATSRLDAVGRGWSPAQVGHGNDVLVIDGFALARGFHWDVQRKKAPERLVTANEVWKIGNGGYVNVYPDAYVRIGSRHNGKLVWSAQ